MISKLTWTCKTGQDGACAMASCSSCCCQVNIQWSVAGNSIGSLVTLQKYIDSLLVPSRAERSSCFQLLCLLTISWHLIQSRRINQFINGRLDNENNLFNVVLEVFFPPPSNSCWHMQISFGRVLSFQHTLVIILFCLFWLRLHVWCVRLKLPYWQNTGVVMKVAEPSLWPPQPGTRSACEIQLWPESFYLPRGKVFWGF